MSDEKKLQDEELDKVSGGTRVNPDVHVEGAGEREHELERFRSVNPAERKE